MYSYDLHDSLSHFYTPCVMLLVSIQIGSTTRLFTLFLFLFPNSLTHLGAVGKHIWLIFGKSWVRTHCFLEQIVINPHCLVLVGSKNRFEFDLTIKLNKLRSLWYIQVKHIQVRTKEKSQKVLSTYIWITDKCR